MTEEDYMYQCEICKKTSSPLYQKAPPVCCSTTMTKKVIFTFTNADDPEMIRNYDEDVTYDHGRGFL